jgi:PAT family beta-lactamase induction signal transducer AmpG
LLDKRFLNIDIILCLLFGISSGLPLVAAGGTLQAWMKQENIDLTKIGLFALASTPYSLKFLWAPLVDRYDLFGIGRRKSWIYLSQATLIILLLIVGQLNPNTNLLLFSSVAFLIAFASATQDIVLDGYRRDILPDSLLGLGSAVFVTGYRIGLLVGGAFSLWMTQFTDWQNIYVMMAGVMLLGVLATTVSEEPVIERNAPRTLLHSFIEPLSDFIKRAYALEVLLFILLYKIGDVFAAAMSSIFILDLGFTAAQLGTVGKTYGLVAAILGGIFGGSLIPKFGLVKSLKIFGVIQAIGILAFAWLAHVGQNYFVLIFSVVVENATSGMGTAAFLAFLGQICDKRFSATQYAVLTSVMSLPRTFLSSGMGALAKQLGWYWYFIFCFITAIPGLVLLFRANLWLDSHKFSNSQERS